METESQRSKGRDSDVSELNTAIETLNLAKELSSIAQAEVVFGSFSIILAMIRVNLLLVFR